ncbi:MAG: hypothetical protein WCF44_14055 [Candidatus Methylophosphatis roskildensis]
MNSLKTLPITKSIIAAAIAASSLAGPAIGQTAPILDPGRSGTPNDGVVCRSGYVAEFSGNNLKCRKSGGLTGDLSCNDARFPKYVSRSPSAINEPQNNQPPGADICIRERGTLSATDSLQGLTVGEAFVYAAINRDKVRSQVAKAGQAEAATLGLAESAVETELVIAFPQPNANGSIKDQTAVQLKHYTFAIPANGPIGTPGPVGLPTTANSQTTFVPRPLP